MAAQLQPKKDPLAPADAATAAPSVDSIMAAQPARLAALQGDVDDTDKQVKDINTKEGALKMPDLQPVPQPTVPQTDPAKIWGSAAMLMAGIGGLMTRRPLVTAMNAATKVFEAYKQGDSEAAKAAYDSWKAANENALKIADFQQKEYKDALDGYEKDKTGALAALRSKMVAFQDTTGVQQLDIHGIQGAQQHLIELKRLAAEQARAAPAIDKGNDQHQAAMEIKSALSDLRQAQGSKDPAKIQAATDKLKQAHQDAVEMNEAYGKGGTTTGSFRSLPAMVANKFAQEHPDASAEDAENFAADYMAKNRAVTAFDTGVQGNSIRSFNTAIYHLSTLNGLIDALNNGDVTAVNKMAQAVAKQTGKPAPTNFDAAKAIVGDEIVKAIVGGGGALADRENAQNQINKAESPEQLRGVIQTYKDLMGGQLRGLKKQYESSTDRKDFDKKLFPETIKQLGGDSGERGPAPAHKGGKPIWPDGDHWAYEDGSTVK